MRLKEENPVLAGLVDSYNLRGFSFREYLNLMASTHFPSYSLSDIITNHRAIAQEICAQVNPLDYFPGYLHHGYYPFFWINRISRKIWLKYQYDYGGGYSVD